MPSQPRLPNVHSKIRVLEEAAKRLKKSGQNTGAICPTSLFGKFVEGAL
jgi:hypothetical protein